LAAVIIDNLKRDHEFMIIVTAKYNTQYLGIISAGKLIPECVMTYDSSMCFRVYIFAWMFCVLV